MSAKNEAEQAPVEGTVQPGYEAVRTAFAENLAAGQELGAHFAVYRNGEALVDLWGGRMARDPAQPIKQGSLYTIFSATKGIVAIQSILDIIPMLMLSLVIVIGLQTAGAIGWLVTTLRPALSQAGIDEVFVLPAITKYLAENTAFVGLMHETAQQPGFDPKLFWRGTGFLIHPLDLPGIAILTSSGPRMLRVLWPALGGAVVGIGLRGVVTALMG